VWNDPLELERSLGPEVGAVLLEPIQGEGGVNPADDSYLTEVRRICDERGILLIFDEIQTGFARTGNWFAFQHAAVMPDIVAFAKAVANGMPVGGIWARNEVAAAFRPGDHGSTYAGQPLALAAASATLHTMIEMDAPSVAAAKGLTLRDRLEALPGIDHVRGRGLLLAAEISPGSLHGRTAGQIARTCLDRGLIVNGVTPTALRLAPPFILADAQIEEGVSIIGSVLEDT